MRQTDVALASRLQVMPAQSGPLDEYERLLIA